MATAAIYARVSTSDQYGNYSYGDPEGRQGTPSYGYQVDDCLAKALELGYTVPTERIVCEVVSGASFEAQAGLHTILTWAMANEIDALFCWHSDRLTRANLQSSMYIRDVLHAHNVSLFLLDRMRESGKKFEDQFLKILTDFSVSHFKEVAIGRLSDDDIEAIASLLAA